MAHPGRLMVVRTSKATAADPARPCTIPITNGLRTWKIPELLAPLGHPGKCRRYVAKLKSAAGIVGVKHHPSGNHVRMRAETIAPDRQPVHHPAQHAGQVEYSQ